MTLAPTEHQESNDGILSVNEGDDLELEDKDRIPYVLVENLGHGASAIVEMVRDINTNQTYARKVFRNYHTRKLQEAKKAFQNERSDSMEGIWLPRSGIGFHSPADHPT